MVQDKEELYLQLQTNSKLYFERRYFHWPWAIPNPDFKVTPLFDAEYLRNGTRYRHSYNGILGNNLHTPYSRVSFRMTSSDLAKYSMTRSIARSLCDSWASCCYKCNSIHQMFVETRSWMVCWRKVECNPFMDHVGHRWTDDWVTCRRPIVSSGETPACTHRLYGKL